MGNEVGSHDKYSLRGRVYQKIRSDILNGHYDDHEELREVAIGEELGVSRTPVREALRQLELEGLVEIIPNKGAYALGITDKDVHDIYMIRSVLEGMAARWATENITEEELEEMEEALYLSDFHASKGHFEQVTEMDNRFHEILYEACNSKRLYRMLSDLHEYIHLVRSRNLSDHDRSVHSTDEHRQIMEALKSRNAELAENLANQHVIKAYQSMLEHRQISDECNS